MGGEVDAIDDRLAEAERARDELQQRQLAELLEQMTPEQRAEFELAAPVLEALRVEELRRGHPLSHDEQRAFCSRVCAALDGDDPSGDAS